MSAFISYARQDEAAIAELRVDVERAAGSAWFDKDIEGGQVWWDIVLERIRTSDLFIFALTPSSLASKACEVELTYAAAVQRTVIPVLLQQVNLELLPSSLAPLQIVDYRVRTPETAVALTLALSRATAGPLPDPLPAPPPAPMNSLGPCRNSVESASLSYDEQVGLLSELRHRGDNADEREAVVDLLQRLRGRPDIVESVGLDVDRLVARLTGASRTLQRSQPRGDDDLSRSDDEPSDLLRSLMTHISTGNLTPILGLGMTDSLVGPRRDLMGEWARSFEFPMVEFSYSDLAHVAQFVAVMSDETTLRTSLVNYIRDQLIARHPGLESRPPSSSVEELLGAAWENARATATADPHMVVASLPCSIFITAHPANLLTKALEAAGKQPVVDVCRWRPGIYDWPESPYAADPHYAPSIERPLVFHIFGNVAVPESLVLTEDDYLGYLLSVTEDKSLIPLPVRGALADSSLLLLGLGLDDWDARVLLLTLINREGAYKLQRYTHVAAQVVPSQNVTSPARARRYLERYFSKVSRPSIDIYWGTVDAFASDLAALQLASR